MITIYDLLEVNENASKEEIEKSYQQLILRYHKDPKLDEEANQDNEIILNKLKIAYDILSDEEKRKKYDKDLANKRAEELIQNVSVHSSQENINEKNNKEQIESDIEHENPILEKNKDEKSAESKKSIETKKTYKVNESLRNEEYSLSKEEKEKVKKLAQKDFKENLKKAQKAEEEYNKAYTEAYNNYLRKMGYTVKEPWTLKRVKNLVITILVIIVVCILIWTIPFTKNLLISIYEENFIVKSLVDIIAMFFNAIGSILKK